MATADGARVGWRSHEWKGRNASIPGDGGRYQRARNQQASGAAMATQAHMLLLEHRQHLVIQTSSAGHVPQPMMAMAQPVVMATPMVDAEPVMGAPVVGGLKAPQP